MAERLIPEDHIMAQVLFEAGVNLADPNFLGTSERWLKYLHHYLQPYSAEQDLGVTFRPTGEGTYDHAMIVQVGIPYRAVCAHHLLPVLGTAHVGYIPNQKVVGLSKLSRVVYGISHAMPSLQEDVCNRITAELMIYLAPLGAMCVITAEHGCMAARGVEEAAGCVQTVTSSVKGVFIGRIETRQEFYDLIKIGSRR